MQKISIKNSAFFSHNPERW